MPDDSVRSHLEANKQLIEIADQAMKCGMFLSAEESLSQASRHAVAALRLLDEAERLSPGTRTKRQSTDIVYVYDPVCGASTENTPC